MDGAQWVGAFVIVGILAFQAWTTRRVWRSSSFERPQKVAQSQLIWLLPLIGAAIVGAVLEDEDKRNEKPPPGLGT